jgi:Spy/CpxP family protein refolding chaperone
MKAVKIIFMAALLIAVTMSAFGQQKSAATQPGGQYHDTPAVESPGQPGLSGQLSEEQREQVRKKIDAVRIWRLTEALMLDADTSTKLSSYLSSIDRQRREILREQTGAIRILKVAIRSPKPDESQMRTTLEKLEKNHHAMQELMKSERSELKNILSIEQQARYVVFQHEFMHEMRGMIGGARGNPGKGGMGVGNGAGMGGGRGQMRSRTGSEGTTRPPQDANQP